MLRKLQFLPKEHLIKKYSDLTGKSQKEIERLVEDEGIEMVSDYLEIHLSNLYQQHSLLGNDQSMFVVSIKE
ncbi:MAG: hypothetical protein PHU86_03345 [Patescibacteria group bacterium]|nr:hypothetical protein [Patescibacteria group bacterium]